MVGADTPLVFSEADNGELQVCDEGGKCYLQVTRRGEWTYDASVIEAFARCYVAFSGKNFPHYLKPLMEEHGVMFNPKRPLVIYDSMGFSLERLDAVSPGLTLSHSSLDVQGKRADALLEFAIESAGEPVGTGSKNWWSAGYAPTTQMRWRRLWMSFIDLKLPIWRLLTKLANRDATLVAIAALNA